jgi:hypothetical protein
MPRKIIITEEQLKSVINEDNMSKGDVEKIVKTVIRQDQEIERRVKNIAADVVKNLFRTLWQKNGLYDKDIRQ